VKKFTSQSFGSRDLSSLHPQMTNLDSGRGLSDWENYPLSPPRPLHWTWWNADGGAESAPWTSPPPTHVCRWCHVRWCAYRSRRRSRDVSGECISQIQSVRSSLTITDSPATLRRHSITARTHELLLLLLLFAGRMAQAEVSTVISRTLSFISHLQLISRIAVQQYKISV